MSRINLREESKSAGAHLTDSEVAGQVRMLMRDQLDHEIVCVMARDRIIALSDALTAALKERDESRAEIDKMRTGPLTDLLAFAGIAPSKGTAHGGLLSEIHRLDAELASLRLRVQEGERLNSGLLVALRSIQGDVCGALCPSAWKTSEGQPPCHERCQMVKRAINASQTRSEHEDSCGSLKSICGDPDCPSCPGVCNCNRAAMASEEGK